jgi:hypothetical protein
MARPVNRRSDAKESDAKELAPSIKINPSPPLTNAR